MRMNPAPVSFNPLRTIAQTESHFAYKKSLWGSKYILRAYLNRTDAFAMTYGSIHFGSRCFTISHELGSVIIIKNGPPSQPMATNCLLPRSGQGECYLSCNMMYDAQTEQSNFLPQHSRPSPIGLSRQKHNVVLATL